MNESLPKAKDSLRLVKWYGSEYSHMIIGASPVDQFLSDSEWDRFKYNGKFFDDKGNIENYKDWVYDKNTIPDGLKYL